MRYQAGIGFWFLWGLVSCLWPDLGYAQEPVGIDLGSRIKITVAQSKPERKTGLYAIKLTLGPKSKQILYGPLSLVVTATTPAGKTLTNAADYTAAGYPYIGIPLAGDSLRAGKKAKVRLLFANPDGKPLKKVKVKKDRYRVFGFVEPPVAITGQAVDDPVTGGTVRVEDYQGNSLGAGTTDGQGRFSVLVDKNAVTGGYRVKVSGGQIAGEPFTGELVADYFATDNPAAAHVTPVTTLVSALAASLPEGGVEQRRATAIQRLVDIGMILQASEWSALAPPSVDGATLRGGIRESGGLPGWLTTMRADLQDGDLSPESMAGFPNAHGGIVQAAFGENSAAKILRGKPLDQGFSVTLYDPESTPAYRYELLDAPDGMSVSEAGIVHYEVSESSPAGYLPFRTSIRNSATGKGRVVNAQVYVMDTQAVVVGTVGPEGGQLSDQWEETVLTVPAGAVDAPSEFKVLRAVGPDGRSVYSTLSSQPLKKVLNIHLPSADLMKSANDPSAGESVPVLRMSAAAASGDAAVFTWTNWDDGDARFIEIDMVGISGARLHENPVNREKNGLPRSSEFTHEKITIHTKDAWTLRSLCPKAAYGTSVCAEREPVLFVHGFSAGGEQSGGQGTWGDFRELLYQRGYAVFEFTWRTPARFNDVADDLALAISEISQASRKKVHIVAHSFGGLLSRTYLQNYAASRRYQGDVRSLVTLGTPHSGIFDDQGRYHGVDFLGGQDSVAFEGCLQISCNEAGEPTPNAYTIPGFFGDIDISYMFGIDTNPGKIAADLSHLTGDHALPVDTLVLIGLTIDRITLADDKYETGDALISYAGQRFLPNLGNSATSETPTFESDGIVVRERILGEPHGAIPGARVWINPDIGFEGYRHSHAWAVLYGNRGDVGEPYVEDSASVSLLDTGGPHAALTEVADWLADHPSGDAALRRLSLTMQVVDAETGVGIQGASVDIAHNLATIGAGVTEANGYLTVDVPFFPASSYTAFVRASTYRAAEHDTGYQTGITPQTSSADFGRISLQADVFAVGDLGGKITDAVSGLPLQEVSYRLVRNGISRVGVTDASGLYSASGLPRGEYVLYASKAGYREGEFHFTVAPYANNVGNASLRRSLADGQMSIRLTWGIDPRDLDSHLIKYDDSGNRLYHIYYSARTNGATGDNLDLDDTSSYGPETTTIQTVDTGATYVFAVHQYAGAGSITTTSNAKVTIDYGSATTTTLQAPTQGDGIWWKVFEISNGEILPCQQNCILAQEPLPSAGFREFMMIPSAGGQDWLSDMVRDIVPK